MWTRKLISTILVCLLLVSSVGTCYAGTTYQLTEQQVLNGLQDSQRLSEIMKILRMNSSEAQQQLLKVTDELQALKQSYAKMESDLTALKQAHATLTESYKTMTNLSLKQEESLNTINNSFQEYSKQTKAKIRSLEVQRGLLSVVVIGLAAKALFK